MSLELNYSTIRGQESMLRDSVRCKAFQRAIADAVTPDCTVLDIGAGTGILSLFAALAGAKAIYAVEQTEIAKVARQIVAENGYSDRITVIQGDIASITLPEKVDIIVSEWLGGYGVDENLLPVVLQARDRWLKPGGHMIPESVTAWMAPADDERLQQEVDFWRSEPYGIDLDLISKATAGKMDCACNHIKQKHILGDPKLLWETNALTDTHEEATQPFRSQLEFIADRDGQFNVLAAWFRANLTKDILLCNGPADPDTHWGRHIFPIGNTVRVKQGTRIAVDFSLEPTGKGESKAVWSLTVGDYHFQSEGITRLVEQNSAGNETPGTINH